MNDIYGYLIALGALIAGVVAAYFKGKSAAKNERLRDDFKKIKQAKDISNEVASLDDDTIRKRARKWVR